MGVTVCPTVSDVLPLPRCGEEDKPRSELSRGTRQRVCRRARVVTRTNECIDALNWLAGSPNAADPAFSSSVQRDVLAHIGSCIREPTEPVPSEEASARALLASRAGYEVSEPGANLAPFKRGSVSLPGETDSAPFATDVLPEKARRMLEGFEEYMLKSSEEYMEVIDHGVPIKPYMDPVLKNNPGTYRKFIGDLDKRGLLHYTTRPAQTVAIFS